MPDRRPQPAGPDRRPWLRRRGTVVGVVGVLVVGGAAAAYASTSSGGTPDYVTATVTRGDVHQLTYLSGTVTLVNQVTHAFPVSGIVKTVDVKPGETVAAGQKLATLQTASLITALLAARSTLAAAQATLTSDQTAAAATVATVAAPTTTAAPSKGSSTKALTADTTAATKALAAEAKACAGLVPSVKSAPTRGGAPSARPHDDPAPSQGPPSGAGPSGTPPTQAQPTQVQPSAAATTSAAATGPTVAQLTACAASLAAVQTAQATVTRDQQQLTSSLSKTSSASTPSRTSGGGSSGGATAESVQSAAIRVITDRAAVTAAQAAVTTAQQDLSAATLHAPIAGTVQSVDLAVGSAAGSSAAVVIVGTGPASVTTDVPLETLKQLKVGQAVQVTPGGATTSVPGTIASLGLLSSSSTTSSTTTYPVVVTVAQPTTTLSSGSTAGISIELATAMGVLTVPSSALTPLATGTALATVISGGKATTARVTTGSVGPTTTEVKTGLSLGQVVALADPSATLPASSATLTRATTFGGFGGGAGGFGGAGGARGAGTARRGGTG